MILGSATIIILQGDFSVSSCSQPTRVLWICSLLACCTRHWWNSPYLFVDLSCPSFSLYQQTWICHCLQRRLHPLANNIQKKATSFSRLQFSLLKMDGNKTLMNSDTALRFLRGIEDFHCQTWLLCYENDSQLKEWENILKKSSTVLRKAGYPGTPGEKLLIKLVRWAGTTFECHNNFIA